MDINEGLKMSLFASCNSREEKMDRADALLNYAYVLALVGSNGSMEGLCQHAVSDYFYLLSDLIKHAKQMVKKLHRRKMNE